MPKVNYGLETDNLRPHRNTYYKGVEFVMSRICNDGSAQTSAANDNVMVESFDHVVAPTSRTSYSRKRRKNSSDSSQERKRSCRRSSLLDFSSAGCGYDERGHDGGYADYSDSDGRGRNHYETYGDGRYYNHGNYGDRGSRDRIHGGDSRKRKKNSSESSQERKRSWNFQHSSVVGFSSAGCGYDESGHDGGYADYSDSDGRDRNRDETYGHGRYYNHGNYGDCGSRDRMHGGDSGREHNCHETCSHGGSYGCGNYGDRGSRAHVNGDRRSHSRLHAGRQSHLH